jgi:hypothetical protein
VTWNDKSQDIEWKIDVTEYCQTRSTESIKYKEWEVEISG